MLCQRVFRQALAALTAALPVAAAAPVEVWLSDPSAGVWLEPQADVSFVPGNPEGGTVIAVDETRRYQTMLGFGASFTDSSAYLVQEQLSNETGNRLLLELFDPDAGIGLNVVRQPLGASDFAVNGNYSYNDLPPGGTDPRLEGFSVRHDEATIIPVLRRALEVNPGLVLMGSPWSPPGWMKTSGSMVTGSLNPDAYGPLARYFVRYIRAYRERGLPTHFVTPNNEPLYEPSGYPGLRMTDAEQRRFIGEHLGPALRQAGLDTKILAYDHNWDVPSYPETVLSDPQAATLTAGTAWHCYGGAVEAQTAVHNSFPEKETHLTECSGGEWQGEGEAAFAATLGLVIHSPREWARSVVLWNLALDEANGPTNGGCLTCRGVVTVSQRNGSYQKTVDYYALGHASKFVRRGAVRIGSSPAGVESVAFRNPGGTRVLVAHNPDAAPASFSVLWGARTFDYTLPAGAAATFVWRSEQGGPTPTYAERAGRTDVTFTSPEGRDLVLSYGEDLTPYSHQLALGRNVLSYTLPVGARLGGGGTALTDLRATASASADDAAPDLAIDGDPATRWASGRGQASGDWFQLDLGRVRRVGRLTLDAGASTGDFVRGYQLYTSGDGRAWGSAVASGPGGGVLDVSFPERQARYLRVMATAGAGNWWSVAEAEVYGPLVYGTGDGVAGGSADSATGASSVRQKSFVTPAGGRALAAYNPADRAATFGLSARGGRELHYTLPPRAAAFFSTAEAERRPPVLTGLAPATGLAGSSVTLRGRSFGAFQGLSAVTFGEVIAPVSAWSDTEVTATVPAEVQTNESDVRVLVGGRPSRPQTLELLRLADALPGQTWQGTASASADGEPVGNMFDGDPATRWSTGTPQAPGQTLTLDLGRPTRLSRVVLDAGGSTGDYPNRYALDVSDDGRTWQNLVGETDGGGAVVNEAFPPQQAQFLRIRQEGSSGSWWSVAELYVFP